MEEMRPSKGIVEFDEFAKLDLRVGKVLECREHGNADKLLVLKIDLGREVRQICAGLKNHYKPEDLVGKQVIVVANLQPRTMRGEISQGLILLASEGTMKQHVLIISPPEEITPGSIVG